MAIPNIPALPMPPQRTSAPANWAVLADAFVMAEYNMVQSMNANVIPAMNAASEEINEDVEQSAASATAAASSASAASTSATTASTAATNAQSSATTASTAATNAQSSASAASTSATNSEASAVRSEDAVVDAEAARDAAQSWAEQAEETVVGDVIADTAISSFQVRSSLNDSIGNFENITINSASGSIAALQNGRIVYTAGASTVTIPASPIEGQIVMVANLTNRADHRIAVGSIPVKTQNAGGFILIDKALFTVTLKYVNASYGWEVL